MTNEETFEKMKKMKLNGMARTFESAMGIGFRKLSPDEFIACLVDAEWDDRYNRKLTRLLTTAKFRYKASLESINYEHKRNLDKDMVLRLSSFDWINKKLNIIISGSTGTGKSYLACALGNNACINNYSVLYYNAGKLFNTLKLKKVDGSYVNEIEKIKKADLLILDDFGLEPFDKKSELFLMEIIEDRHGQKSTIITSQYPASSWHDVVNNQTIADAVCDRILHSSYVIELKGNSLRKNNLT